MNKRTPASRAIRLLRFGACGSLLVAACFVPAAALAASRSAAQYYEDALVRYEKNDVGGAVVQLKNALQRDQRMLAAHLLLGKALLRYGDLKGAEAAFEEALKQGVSRGEIALPLGQIYLAQGRPEAVIERIPASGLPTALQVEVLTMRANAYAESGNGRLAAQSLDEARALDPRSATPLIAEVPMLLAAGQRDRAQARAEQALALAPASGAAWSAKASVLHAALDASGALNAYDKALGLDPRLVDARVARAGLLIDLARDADAQRDLDFLREQVPDEPRAAFLRAILAGRRGDAAGINAALTEITQSIDALPPVWLARREQLLMTGALAHHALGNGQKARAYLDILVARNPRNLGAKKLLASIYVATRDYTRAVTLLEALRKEIPDDPMAMYLLGTAYMAQRHYLQASELLERAATLTGAPEMTRTLAFSQLGLGRDELGQANLEKAFFGAQADNSAGTALAMLYVRQGQAPKALSVAETMVKRDPGNLTTLNFLGSIRGATGDPAGARAAYTQVLARDPAFRPAMLNRVRLDIGERQFDKARAQLDRMLAVRSDDIDALYEYGMLEQRAGRLAEAVRYLRKASEVRSQDARAALALIDVQLRLQQADEALETAKALVSRLHDNLSAQVALARVYLAKGDAGSARGMLTRAARLANYDVAALLPIARLQLAAADPDGAAYSVTKALQGRPDDVAAMAFAVEVEMRRGDTARADAVLKELVAKYPGRVETAQASAALAMSRGHHAQAVEGYRKAFSLEENSANALALAAAYLVAGEAAKAASFLEGWSGKRPDDLLARKALAEAQFRAGQLAAARRSYARAVADDPDDAVLLNNYANLLLQLGDAGALDAARKAQKLAPGNALFGDTLGWILVQQGEFEAGLPYLREARLRNPENGEIRFHLAHALAKTGRKAEAREELRAALGSPASEAQRALWRQLEKDLGA